MFYGVYSVALLGNYVNSDGFMLYLTFASWTSSGRRKRDGEIALCITILAFAGIFFLVCFHEVFNNM